MRSKRLAVWYILLGILVLEMLAYGAAGLMANSYRKVMWEQFNTGVREWREADSSLPYADLINRVARQVGLNGQLVGAVIKAESSFQPRALSKAGAYGLMQVVPSTWQQVNKDSKVCVNRHAGECTSDCYFNPELNIRIGTAYLGQMYKNFEGNMVLALAAYNAGPGEVSRCGGVPPYRETNEYIDRIIAYWYDAQHKPLPGYGLNFVKWKGVQTMLGWWIILTVALIVFVMWRLHKRYKSWRWH